MPSGPGADKEEDLDTGEGISSLVRGGAER